MKNLTILPVQSRDLSILLKMAKSTFVNNYGHLNDPKNFTAYVEANFSLEKISREFNHPESAFFFAKLEDEICGYLKLNWGNGQTDHPLDNALEIERIYVLQDFQGQKLGKRMVEEALKFAAKKQLNWLWLGVWERNPKAIGFYKKVGFEAFGEHVFMLGPEQQIDILMRQRVL